MEPQAHGTSNCAHFYIVEWINGLEAVWPPFFGHSISVTHHSIFFTLFVSLIPVTGAAFSFSFFFSVQTHRTYWKKNNNNRTDPTIEKNKEKKKEKKRRNPEQTEQPTQEKKKKEQTEPVKEEKKKKKKNQTANPEKKGKKKVKGQKLQLSTVCGSLMCV